MHRISVDFNTMAKDRSGRRRVIIPVHVNPELLGFLRPGLRVVLYEEDLEAEAVVERDEERNIWWGCPDPATYRDLPWP